MISFTGHSLGGAMATIAAVEATRNHLPVRDLITFGSPRVGMKLANQHRLAHRTPLGVFSLMYSCLGNPYFSKYLASLKIVSLRVVNNHDIVPHGPPRSIFNYHHVARELWIHNGTLVACDDSGLVSKFSSSRYIC